MKISPHLPKLLSSGLLFGTQWDSFGTITISYKNGKRYCPNYRIW